MIRRAFLFFFLVCLGFALFLETESGQKEIRTYTESKLQALFPYRFHVGKIHCLFPFYLQLEDLAIETQDEKPILFLSSLTMMPLPIPSFGQSWHIPYLSLHSFSVHTHHLLGLALSQKTSSLSFSIAHLRVYNGEIRDSNLPVPYTFSFRGKTEINHEHCLIAGSLYDQTSALPLRKARGKLLFHDDKIDGVVSCTFKQHSLMSSFQRLVVTFDSAQHPPKTVAGSWKLEGEPTRVNFEKIFDYSINLQGTFSLPREKNTLKIDCQEFRLESSCLLPHSPTPFTTTCTGQWAIEGMLRPDYSFKIALKSLLLHTGICTIQADGKLLTRIQDDGFHVSSDLEGTCSSVNTNSTLSMKGEALLSAIQQTFSARAVSPFASAEAHWKKDRSRQTGSLVLDLISLPHILQNAPFQSLLFKTSYDSSQEQTYQSCLNIHNFSYQDTQIQNLHLQSLLHSFSPLEGKTDLSIEKAVWKKTEVKNGIFHVVHNKGTDCIDAHIDGAHALCPFHLETAFSSTKQKNETLVRFSQWQGTLGTSTFSQTQPITCSFDSLYSLKDIHASCSLGNEGMLSLSTTTLPGRKSHTAIYEKCPLLFLTLFTIDKNIHGTLTGKTSWSQGPIFPRSSFEGSCLFDVPISTPTPSTHTVKALFDIKNNQGQGEGHLFLHDLSSEQTCSCTINSDRWRMHGFLRGSMDIGVLLFPFTDQTLSFSGNTNFDIQFHGTPGAPLFLGSVSIHKGTFIIPTLEATLSNIEVEGSCEKSELRFSSIQGESGQGGALNGKGFMQLQGEDLLWQMQLILQNARFIDLPSVQATATGQVFLDGKNGSLNISAYANLDSGTIDISQNEKNSYPSLPITYRSSGRRLPIQPQTKTSSLSLDIHLEAIRSLCIKGRSFDTLWSGKALLHGPLSLLDIHSSLTCDEGALSFANKKATIERGTIETKGSAINHSSIDIVAVAPLSQGTARIFIGGRLDDPQIRLRSSPVHSEKEILSLLLFNKEITNISPFQSLQLANTALSLEKKTPGSFFFDTFKNSLGIDTIDISSQNVDPNEVTLSVGKYISDGVAVTLSKDISSEANRVGVEVDLAHNIKASATIGDDADALVSLTWKKEF